MSSALGDIVSVGSFGLIDGGDLTGENASDAARSAAAVQSASADKAIELQKESRDLARADLEPFREFGSNQIGALSNILTPEGQYDFLNDNPLVQMSLDQANQATLNNAAARGKLGSGSTLQSLTDNAILTSLPLLQNQQNQLFNAVNLGQASASGSANNALLSGNNLANLTTQQGAVQAGGIVGAQTAGQQAFNNLLGAGTQLGGAALISDRRLKHSVEKVGEDEFGNVYEFNYHGVEQRYRGRIAQELKTIRPDAVGTTDEGYLFVTEEFAARAI